MKELILLIATVGTKYHKIHLVASVPLFSGDHVAFTGSVVAKHPCPSCASMFHLFGRKNKNIAAL